MTDRLRDEGRTDRRTQGKTMMLSHTFTMRGSDVASLVEFRPVVDYDSQMDGRRMHGRTDAQKNNATFAHPYHEGKFN